MDRIGVLCNEDHEVLSEVAEILEERGTDVVFLDPGERLNESEVSDYDVMVPKKSREAVYHNMRLADDLELETLNGFLTGMSADHNLASLRRLERSGFNVPGVELQKPESGEFIEKPVRECYREEPRKLNGHEPRKKGFFLEEFIDSDGIDYKIYLIDGEEPYIEGLMEPSKLLERSSSREKFDPREVGFGTDEAREVLSTFYDADFLGVDIIESSDGKRYIVDVNAAPSFRGAEGAPENLAEAVYSKI